MVWLRIPDAHFSTLRTAVPCGAGWLLKTKAADTINLAALLDAAGCETHCAAHKC